MSTRSARPCRCSPLIQPSKLAGKPAKNALFGNFLADLRLVGVEALFAAEVQVAREGKQLVANQAELAAALVAAHR
jgi:hypothetical protein